MQVLIEELSSGLFYKTETEWVRSKTKALTFSNLRSAIEFCLKRTMPDVRILVSFENSEHDFYLRPFGRDELATTTQRLLARNRQLQHEQWALSSEITAAVGELRETCEQLRSERQERVDSPTEPGQAAA